MFIYRFLSGITLSMFVHFLIAYNILFTFPLKVEPKKPSFIFLGSILKNQDVVHIHVNKRNHLPKLKEEFNPQIQEVSGQTLKPWIISKPQHSQSMDTTEKLTEKSTFEVSLPQSHADKNITVEELGVDLAIPSYKPLELLDP